MSMFSRLRRSVALFICPELGGALSNEPVKIGASHLPDENTDIASVWFVKCSSALGAGERIAGAWLKDRFDLLLIAGCAYAVRGLAIGLAGVKLVDERILFRSCEDVANCLGFKFVDATLFLAELQNCALHRYLLRLKLDQPIEQVRDEIFRRSGIDVRLFDQILDALRGVRRSLGETYQAGACRNEGGHGF